MPRKATKSQPTSSLCPITGSPVVRAQKNAETATIADSFPKGIGQPALRALYAAGYKRLEELIKVSEKELLALHGVGPKAVRIMREALQEKDLDYRR
jgi:hypothetical protein